MFVDSHAHIDGPEFDEDREAMFQRARDAGLSAILNVGTGDPHSGSLERAVQLGEACAKTLLAPEVYTAVGVHPHDARLYDEDVERRLLNLITRPTVIAWGEIGLDFHYDNSPRDAQVDVFRRQLRAARAARMPIIIHTREAEGETVEILKSEWSGANLSGVMHCFSGTRDLAQKAMELGLAVSFSGIVTFKKADDLRAIAREIPIDRLLIETDCPYLAPIPFRGKRNEPAYVVEVARCLAELRGLDVQEIGRISAENFGKVFQVQVPRSFL